MGVVFSCFHVDDEQDDDNCSCPKCFFHKLKIKFFRRGHTSAIPQLSFHNSSDANHEERERQEEGARVSQVHPEPIEHAQPNPTQTQQNETLISKDQDFESSTKIQSSGVDGIAYTFASPDDEDVCPTCLEDYTEENPKIIAKCSHYYHLSCIYEWMERSPHCPICRKLMLFDESN